MNMTPALEAAIAECRGFWGRGPRPGHESLCLGNVVALCVRAGVDPQRARDLYAEPTTGREVGTRATPGQLYPPLIEVDVGLLMSMFPEERAAILDEVGVPTLALHFNLWLDIFDCPANRPPA